MPVKFGFDNNLLKAWLLLHQTYNAAVKAEEETFSKLGLSPQQYSVLMAIRYTKGSVTPTSIANWVDRKSNAISLLTDRMAKAGLVHKVRSTRDRREVRLQLTSKGKEILDEAVGIGWYLIQDILGGMPEEKVEALINLLETIRGRAFNYTNPGQTIKEVATTGDAGDISRYRKQLDQA